jgi:hypothetical protein
LPLGKRGRARRQHGKLVVAVAARGHFQSKIPLLSGNYQPTGNAFAARARLMNKGP